MRPIEKSARPVGTGPEIAPSEAANLLGDFSALLQQIGSPVVSAALPSPKGGATPGEFPALQEFLEAYLSEILLPLELPAIVEACGHARRGELRELIAQDQRLNAPLRLTPFAGPSRQIGRLQLTRMRPLRDDRTVQRYLAAVESGHAHGWHTVVYGLTLAVYSLPLRQGLLYYAQETLAGLAGAAARGAGGAQSDLSRALEDLLARVPAAVEASLAGNGAPGAGPE
ncbi:MAG: urease accessory UreF family protein [Verrucomicrobiota bacterium]